MTTLESKARELLAEAVSAERRKGYAARLGEEQPLVPECIAVEVVAAALRLAVPECRAHECTRIRAEMQAEIDRLREIAHRVEAAPVAIMDTRDVLGICAPTEGDFPALYALQGKRVALVEVPNE